MGRRLLRACARRRASCAAAVRLVTRSGTWAGRPHRSGGRALAVHPAFARGAGSAGRSGGRPAVRAVAAGRSTCCTSAAPFRASGSTCCWRCSPRSAPSPGARLLRVGGPFTAGRAAGRAAGVAAAIVSLPFLDRRCSPPSIGVRPLCCSRPNAKASACRLSRRWRAAPRSSPATPVDAGSGRVRGHLLPGGRSRRVDRGGAGAPRRARGRPGGLGPAPQRGSRARPPVHA